MGRDVQEEDRLAKPRRAQDRPSAPERELRSPLAPPARLADLPTVEPSRGGAVPEAAAFAGAEDQETVVSVTIGRIDVRAVPPPAPARRAARPAGPRLSLADYLKQRGEGRR